MGLSFAIGKAVRSSIFKGILLAASVFLVEFLIMGVLQRTPWINKSTKALIDSLLIALLLIPGIYYIFLRPMLPCMKTEQIIRRVGILAILIFLVEYSIMTIIPQVHWINATTEALIDSIVLVLLLIPGLYYLLFRPMAVSLENERTLNVALGVGEAQFRGIFEQSPIAIEVYDSGGLLVRANRACLDLFGLDDIAEIIGLKLFKDPNLSKDAKEQLQNGIAVQYEAEFDFDLVKDLKLFETSKSGKYFINMLITPLRTRDGNENGGYLVQVQDITERWKAEKALQDREHSYQTLAKNLPGLVYRVFLQGNNRMQFFNDQLKLMTGYSPEEFLAKDIRSIDLFIVEEDRERVISLIKDAVQNKQPFEVEYRFCWKDGTIRHFIERGTPVMSSDGKPAHIDGVILDITERKEVGEALRKSEEDLRNLYANAMEGIFRTTPNGKFLFANPAMAKMFGYDSVDDILKTNAELFYFTDEQREENTQLYEQYGHVKDLELEMLRKDGSKVWVRISSTVVRDEAGNTKWYEGFISNISKSKKLEKDLLKAQKLESVGQLAGGLAHDFNNTLMTIQLNAATASLEENVPSTVMETLRAIDESVTKAKGITRQLLTFARGGNPVKKTTDLRNLIRESVQFALAGTNILPSFEIDDDLYFADIDQGQIDQVVNNLVINARHAMPTGGSLKIVGRNISVTPANRLGSLALGNYSEISIQDQGHGIDAVNLEKIFDPYFTTKEEGSGLGLFSCYSIMDKHKGWLAAESKVDVGSEFTFYLPQSREVADNIISREVIKGTGRILIMDDEYELRAALSKLLNRIGYATAAAADGEEIIRMYSDARNTDDAFDLVILDLTIPNGLGGKETAMRLKEIDPNVKAIVSSGYSNESVMADFRAHGFSAVLAKPYKLAELATVVRNTIDQI